MVAQQKVLSSNPVCDIYFFEFSGSDDFQSSMGLADLLRAAGSAGHAHARIYAHRATVGIFFNK